MPNYRRNWVPGGTFFFTLVTAGRVFLFLEESARTLLGQGLRLEREARPFTIDAIVLLPDHLHVIWTHPPGDFDFAIRWASIKSRFTREWLDLGNDDRPVLPGQQREGRRGVWQPRFIEHTIRDEDDLIQHVNYIHFNPVKHGLVRCPRDWRWTSFFRYVRSGEYPIDWACSGSGVPPYYDRVDANLVD